MNEPAKAAGAKTIRLPVCIARALVVFPSMSEEIDVGRAISVAAVEKARTSTNSLMIIVSQKDEKVDNPTEEDIYKVGTMCRIISYSQTDTGVRVRVVGSKRARLQDLVMEDGAIVTEAELLEYEHGPADEELALTKKIVEVISNSPRAEGSTFLAISTTRPS